MVRSSGSRVVPSISPVNNPTFPISFPFPLFPSFPPPCSLQIKEHRVPKDVKDLFLALSFQDPTPILAGFLPASIKRYLKKRSIEYKSEIEIMRVKIVGIVSNMMDFGVSNQVSCLRNIAADHIKVLFESTNVSREYSTIAASYLDVHVKEMIKNVEVLDKDARHCDRLKRFRALPVN